MSRTTFLTEEERWQLREIKYMSKRIIIPIIAITLFLMSGCIINSSLNLCSSQHMQSAEDNIASAKSDVSTELQNKIEKTVNKSSDEGGLLRKFLQKVF